MVKEKQLLKDSLNGLTEIQCQYEEILQRQLKDDSVLQDMSNVNWSVMSSEDLHKISNGLAALKVKKYKNYVNIFLIILTIKLIFILTVNRTF